MHLIFTLENAAQILAEDDHHYEYMYHLLKNPTAYGYNQDEIPQLQHGIYTEAEIDQLVTHFNTCCPCPNCQDQVAW